MKRMISIMELAVQIVRFVDEYQPGIAACEFVEADGRRHTLIDKVQIFSVEPLDANSQCPRSGAARCIALKQWGDAEGRELIRISTLAPDRTAHPDQPT